MNWQQLFDFLEPFIPFFGIVAILIVAAILVFATTGSMAAIEITKYYRRQNRLLDEAEKRQALEVTESSLRNTLQGAVLDAVAPLRNDIVQVKAELNKEKTSAENQR